MARKSAVLRAAVLAALLAALVPDAIAQSACERISAACEAAGFVRGGATAGNGILVDCVEPILQGRALRRAERSLPQIDPQLVAQCRSEDPAFGGAKGGARTAPGDSSSGAAGQTAPAAGAPAPAVSARRAAPDAGAGPNIIFILTDDLSWNLVQFMPHVLQMQKDGVTFDHYFVTDSLCCPSRSSIFTGRYPHDTGVFRNTGLDGGYHVFRERGHENATFATWLSAAGYRTAMLGKYLNGYQPASDPPARGWSLWAVAGNAYREFRYNLNQNAKVVDYGTSPADYLTDVLSSLAVDFIRQQTEASFIIEVATFAPHAPYTPAPRDANAFPGIKAPRPPAFDAAPDAAAAKWLLAHPALSPQDLALIDAGFRKRAQSVLAVDKMIGVLQAAVKSIGAEKNTYFVFSSDNGYHMGEHRLLPGKMTAYDTDIRVPLIVTGPGVPAGRTVEEVAENVDLCPTFAELAGTSVPRNVDGRSLVPLLHGENVPDWKRVALIEHRHPNRDKDDPDAPGARSGNPPTYEAIRGADFVYVEYAGGDFEYHDLTKDPHEVANTFGALSADQKAALRATLQAVKDCHDAESCRRAARGDRLVARK
jgi:N-acetylglucosamine-6-sulfatase